MNKKIIIKKSGQILVETMVALGMTVIALLGILSLLSSSLAINKVISDQYVATYLASEGIEIVKNIIDANVVNGQAFNYGLNGCGGGCAFQYNSTQKIGNSQSDIEKKLKFDKNTGIYSYDNGDNTKFSRYVKINIYNSGGVDKANVESVVKWVSRGGVAREVVLDDVFYNWRER